MESLVGMLPFILVIVVFFWWMTASQRKAPKQRQEMLGGIKVGDSVETVARMYGRVVEVSDSDVVVDVSAVRNERYKIRMHREAIARKIVEDEGAESSKKDASKEGGEKSSESDKKSAIGA